MPVESRCCCVVLTCKQVYRKICERLEICLLDRICIIALCQPVKMAYTPWQDDTFFQRLNRAWQVDVLPSGLSCSKHNLSLP